MTPALRKRTLTMLAGAVALVATFAVGFRVARAAVPPDDSALVYSGVLEDNGALVEGQRAISVELFDDDVAGAVLCESGTQQVSLVRGRFQIAMPAACAAALRAPGDAFVEVVLDGDSLGRAPIAAVPFALAAGEAAAATPGSALEAAVDVATEAGVPSGAVLAFDLDACPPGWSELVPARGRTIVGTNPAGIPNGLSTRTRGQVFGAERHTLSTSEMPIHAHGGATTVPLLAGIGINAAFDYAGVGGARGVQFASVASPANFYFAHSHGIAPEGGSASHENMQPSLALLYCKRD
jgi:hypothetical protein